MTCETFNCNCISCNVPRNRRLGKSSYGHVHRQVLRLSGAEYILGGQDFCFYDIFKTNFSGHNKFGGDCPRMPLLGHGLVVVTLHKSCFSSIYKLSNARTTQRPLLFTKKIVLQQAFLLVYKQWNTEGLASHISVLDNPRRLQQKKKN